MKAELKVLSPLTGDKIGDNQIDARVEVEWDEPSI